MLTRSRFYLLISFLLVAGCAHNRSSSPDDSDGVASNAPLKIDVFSARGFLGGSEYERYYLTGSVLWRECGSISAAGKTAVKHEAIEGDKVLSPDPQLHIQERRVEKLTREQRDAIKTQALTVIGAMTPENKQSDPPPGSVFSLGDPGLFEMMVSVGDKKQRIISNVDAVADNSTPVLQKAHELFAQLRGIGPEMCGSKTFYGIGKQAS